MIISVRRVALVLIPLLAGFGLLALAWSLLFGERPVPLLPPPFLSTQASQPLSFNRPPPTLAPEAPIITIAASPYRHPSGAFAIKYPDAWQIDESEDSVQFTAPDEAAAQFSVTFASSAAVASGEAAGNGVYERDLRETWGDLLAFSIQTTNADQLPKQWSATFTFTQPQPPNPSNMQMIGYTIYQWQDGIRYTFVALAPAQAWPQIQPVIQSITNSLQTYPNAVKDDSE
jgi:hypothetical protein